MAYRKHRLLLRFACWSPFGLASLPLLAGCGGEGYVPSRLAPPAMIGFKTPKPRQPSRTEGVAQQATPAAGEENHGIQLVAATEAAANEKHEQAPPQSCPALPSSTQEEGRDALPAKVLPITLDTVLRLAEDQNTQIALARARVAEACAASDLAGRRWLPDVYLGTGYYRHEGGIQDQNGDQIFSSTGAWFHGLELNSKLDFREVVYQQVNAQRKAWQQKGELSRITNEILLEAASTYIDLLTARSGEAIARRLMQDLEYLRDRADKLAESEPAAKVEGARVRAELLGRRQTIRRLQAQAQAASAKLVYLLGLDPCTELMPVDRELIPFDLVDVSPPTCELVEKVLQSGPGIREWEGLVNLVESAWQRSQGLGRFLPSIEVRMLEGAFGAGPGANLKYENRWDLGLALRWNLSEWATRHERQRLAHAQRDQAHLAYQDLRSKLTAGVQEARETIIGGSEQIRIGKEQIQQAEDARNQSKQRLDKTVPGSTITEMLLTLQSLAAAQLGHLSAVAEYDKAQLRLLLLLGCSH